MSLPSSLQHAIQALIENSKLQVLAGAREELTARYRNPTQHKQFMLSDQQRLSYVATRFPATYAAIKKAIKAIQKQDSTEITSVLDLGAGPGTAMWALADSYSSINRFTLIEQDSALLSIGKYLATFSEDLSVRSAHWQIGNLEEIEDFIEHDLVILSYSIGELEAKYYEELLEKAWKAAKKFLVIIEPGTPVGFERIRQIRSFLLSKDAQCVAPCPHQLTCPMNGGDWCHFMARVERSSLHRQLKKGSLGHEDEKFSYIAVSKTPSLLPESRILSHPERHSGHVKLKLCTIEGLQFPILSKKMGNLYKQARKADWGDTFNRSESSTPVDS